MNSKTQKTSAEFKNESWQWLARAHPWPTKKPVVDKMPFRGWLNKGTAMLLREHMVPDGVVVELGTWRGLSARRMLSRMGAGGVVCIDHWKGSVEHVSGCYKDRVKDVLPQLYELFCCDSWDFRDRIIPLRMDTISGLHTVRERGVVPDLIYVDASHEFRPVFNELVIASMLFPSATIVGDDWYIKGVREAAKYFDSVQNRYLMIHNRKGFCFEPND